MERPLSGARVLVTGANGFIGRRLAHRLVADGAKVRAMVRRVHSGVALARLPVEVCVGDVVDPVALRAAVDGCDVVVNLAKGTSAWAFERWGVDVDGARNVVRAAHDARVARVVQMSSVLAYGLQPDGDMDERARRRASTDLYSMAKRRGDALVRGLGAELGVPAVVLHPTAVYGPGGSVWSEGTLRMLSSGRVILVDGGRGTCNAVYVDDVVDAVVRAATSDRAVGEELLVSGAEPFPWRDFYRRFEAMVGAPRLVSMTAGEARAYWLRRWRARPSALREVRSTLLARDARRRLFETREGAVAHYAMQYLPTGVVHALKRAVGGERAAPVTPAASEPDELPITPWGPFMVKFLAARTTVRIDKARRLLAWEPAVDFATGTAATEQWARWAGLVPPAGTHGTHPAPAP